MLEIYPKFNPPRFLNHCRKFDGGGDFGEASSSTTDNTSLITSIGGDITKLGTAFIAEQGAVATAKTVSHSPNAQVLVYGGVAIAALVVIFLLFRK